MKQKLNPLDYSKCTKTIFFRNDHVNWPHISCGLTLLDSFFGAYVKIQPHKNNLQSTLEL